MLIVKATSANDLYHKLLAHFCHKQATPLTGINHGTYIEERNAVLVMTNPYEQLVTLKCRNLSLRYLAGEFACYMARYTTDAFAFYSKLWRKIDVDGIAQSNYGRITFYAHDGLISWYDYAKNNLLKNKDTKNAIIMLQSAKSKRPGYDKDRPCAMSIQFFIRNDKLEMDVCLRSSDVWLGLPYDIHWFSFVQQRMALDIGGIALGTITYHIASLHVYERHFNKLSTDNTIVPIEQPVWSKDDETTLQNFLKWEDLYRCTGGDNTSLELSPLLNRYRHYILHNEKVVDYE